MQTLAEFDARGLWSHRGAHFSLFGTLIDTAEQFVVRCERGYLASELAHELQAAVKEPLLKLVNERRLVRKDLAGQFVYFAAQPSKRAQQQQLRQMAASGSGAPLARDPLAHASEETRAAIILFFSTLDEHQRRLYAGLESLRLGHGSDTRIAELTGLDVHNRPSRFEPRMRKRRPKPHRWLKIPRAQARRQIDCHGHAWETK